VFSQEGVNFSSQPLNTLFIVESLCNKNKYVAEIQQEEIYTEDNLLSVSMVGELSKVGDWVNHGEVEMICPASFFSSPIILFHF
jgi:hypothetical protein